MKGLPAKPIMVVCSGEGGAGALDGFEDGGDGGDDAAGVEAGEGGGVADGGEDGAFAFLKVRPWPRAQGTMRMSLKRMAASKP